MKPETVYGLFVYGIAGFSLLLLVAAIFIDWDKLGERFFPGKFHSK